MYMHIYVYKHMYSYNVCMYIIIHTYNDIFNIINNSGD